MISELLVKTKNALIVFNNSGLFCFFEEIVFNNIEYFDVMIGF